MYTVHTLDALCETVRSTIKSCLIPAQRHRPALLPPTATAATAMFSDNTKIGGALVFLGALFTVLGVMLFFDKALLTMGNVMFLMGFAFLSGVSRTLAFFAARARIRGTVCFFFGVFMILMGWTFTGMAVESFGFVNLFGNFFPVALTWMRSMPYLGALLNAPVVKQCLDKLANLKDDPRVQKATEGSWA